MVQLYIPVALILLSQSLPQIHLVERLASRMLLALINQLKLIDEVILRLHSIHRLVVLFARPHVAFLGNKEALIIRIDLLQLHQIELVLILNPRFFILLLFSQLLLLLGIIALIHFVQLYLPQRLLLRRHRLSLLQLNQVRIVRLRRLTRIVTLVK